MKLCLHTKSHPKLTPFSPVCPIWPRLPHLAPFNPVWPHLLPFAPVWSHLALFAPVCSCLVPFGPIWPCLALLGQFLISISRYIKVPIHQGAYHYPYPDALYVAKYKIYSSIIDIKYCGLRLSSHICHNHFRGGGGQGHDDLDYEGVIWDGWLSQKTYFVKVVPSAQKPFPGSLPFLSPMSSTLDFAVGPILQCHNVMIMQCCNVTMLQCYNAAILQCYTFAILHCCNVDVAM